MPLAEHWLDTCDDLKHESELVFVVEDRFHVPGTVANGHRVVSMTDFLAAPAAERRFNIAIGNSAVRERIANAIPAELATPFSIVAPSHIALCNNTVGEGAIWCSFTHVTSNARIGRFFHANFYSYVAHDCVVGDFVTFAPGVMCNGNVVVEDHVYVGTGAVIKQGNDEPLVIGRGAVVGMGAVVTRSVPPGTTVIGSPARPLVK